MNVKNVTVTHDFFDGDLAAAFSKLGYPAKWKAGERRDVPQEVIRRVIASGGIVTFAEDGAKESTLPVFSQPRQDDLQAHYEAKYGKAKRVRVLFVETFRDGTLEAECAAVGHPAEFGVGEIAELPQSLLDKIRASGGLVSTNAEEIEQAINQQGKHQKRIQEWREERDRQAKSAIASRAAAEHNAGILQEIETLSTRALTATGKTKEALWQRINELHQSLK